MRLRRLAVAFVLVLVSAAAAVGEVRNKTPVDDPTTCSTGQICWTESVYHEQWIGGVLYGYYTTEVRCLCQ
jgi:hypothetical protein